MQHSCFWVLSIFHWRVCSTTHTHNGRQLWQYHQHPWQQCPSNRAEPSDSTFPSDKFFLHLGTVPSEIESRRDRTLPFFFFFFTIFFFSFPFFIYLNNALFFSPPETGLHINVRARGGELLYGYKVFVWYGLSGSLKSFIVFRPPAGTFVFLFCYLFEAFFLHYFCALSFGPIQPENRNDCPAEGRLIMFDLPCSTFFPKLLANNLSRFSYQLLARWCPSPYDPVVTKRRHSSPSRWSATVRQQFSSCHFLFAFASQTQ